MHYDRSEKLILHTASLKLAAPSGQYIPDPPTILSIGERNEESVGPSKNIDRRPVEPARLSTNVCNDSEAGQLSGKPACDSVRYSSMEGRYRPLAKPNENDGNHQDCQKRDDRCSDDHGRLSSYPLFIRLQLEASPPSNLSQISFEATVTVDILVWPRVDEDEKRQGCRTRHCPCHPIRP